MIRKLFSGLFSGSVTKPAKTTHKPPLLEIPGVSLYHRYSCPYCRYVMSFMRVNNLAVAIKDTAAEQEHLDTLIQEGGKSQVPCLRIEDGGVVRWMYESADIVEYLKKHVRKD